MSLNLVCKGQYWDCFSIPWKAATIGVRHVSKKLIIEINISQICEYLTEYICSTSDSPRSRLSLRLSSILINGTLRIYRQKVIFVLDDVVKMLTRVKHPIGLELPFESGIFVSPPIPVGKKKLKQKRLLSEESSSESEWEKILTDFDPFAENRINLQARSEDITLREIQQPLHREESDDDFDIMGPVPEEEDEEWVKLVGRQQREISPSRALSSPVLAPALETIPEFPGEPMSQKRSVRYEPYCSSSSSESGFGVGPILTGAQIDTITKPSEPLAQPEIVQEQEKELPPEPVIEEVPEVHSEPAPIQEHRRPLRDISMTEVEERDRKSKEKITKKIDPDMGKMLVSTKPIRVVRIDRCELDEVELVDINPCLLPEFRLRGANVTNLMKMFLTRDDRDLQIMRKVPEDSRLEDSIKRARKSRPRTPFIEVPSEPVMEEKLTPVMEERVEERFSLPQGQIETPPPAQHSTTEIEEKMFEEDMASPAKRHRLFEMEPEAATGTTEQSRRQDIVDKVSLSDRVTLDEICVKPINRLNIARAFNDALSLWKDQYLTLVSKENSIELDYITKGPKVLSD